MINNSRNMNRDLRKEIAKEEQNNREIEIKLQNMYDPFSKAMWREKQNDLYLNTLRVKNYDSLGQLIANDLESKKQNDPEIVKQISLGLLNTITESSISQYIVDRLTTEQLNRMNQYWPQILHDMKRKNLKLNKDVFIKMMKENVDQDQDTVQEPELEPELEPEPEAEPEPEPMEEQQIENEERDKKKKDDRLKMDDDRDNIQPVTIGNITTREFCQNIIFSKEIILKDLDENETAVYMHVLQKLENPVLQKKDFINYIDRRISRHISLSLRKEDMRKIAIYVGFSHMMNQSKEQQERFLQGGSIVKRKIFGRGIKKNEKKLIVNKFTIDMDKLNKNILCVRYSSCRSSLPSMRIERISNDVKIVLLDILNNKYNENLFNKLMTDDQRIVSHFVRTLKIKDINMDSFDKAYQHEYEVLLGEVNSGNDNEQIRKTLKQYILRGISENLIPRNQGLSQILNL